MKNEKLKKQGNHESEKTFLLKKFQRKSSTVIYIYIYKNKNNSYVYI